MRNLPAAVEAAPVEVPSLRSALAVPSMVAALGLDAFVGIENHGRGGNADSDEQHLASPVWWEADTTRLRTVTGPIDIGERSVAYRPRAPTARQHTLRR